MIKISKFTAYFVSIRFHYHMESQTILNRNLIKILKGLKNTSILQLKVFPSSLEFSLKLIRNPERNNIIKFHDKSSEV